MQTRQESATLRDAIREARTTGRPVPSGGCRLDLAEAYGVQEELGEGRELRGYKLGLLSPEKQAQMGISAPVYGRVYGDMLVSSPVPLGRFLQPKMEPEVAVKLAQDVPPDAAPGEARTAVGEAFLGVDFLDSVWEGYKFTISDVVADNASGGGFLLGDAPLRDPFAGTLQLLVDGESVAEGPVGALGDVGERLAWLAGEVGGLLEGQVVFLGSPVAAVPARAGRLELRGDGEVLVAELRG